jgi:sugar phosphate isomerase/epimerase
MWTVREAADRDLPATLERIAEIGYLGIELVGLHGTPPDEFLALVDRFQLEVIGSGLPAIDEDEMSAWLTDLDAIGCDFLSTELGAEHFTSSAAISVAAELCNRFAAERRGEGKTVVYHNHWWEFTPGPDGKAPMFEFVRQLDPEVELIVDLYWVATGGTDIVMTLNELAPRVRRLHLKDGPFNTTDPMTAVGAGKLDVAAAVAAAPQVDWHVAELDEFDGDPLDALAESYRYLTEGGFSHGRTKS